MSTHNSHSEVPLVVFTLLMHHSTGSFWTLGIIYLWASIYSNAETARQLVGPSFLTIIPLLVIAPLVSLLHLGTPLNAWRAAANLRSSWLSREIVFTLLFTLLEAAFAWTFWQQIGEQWLWILLGLGATLAGGLAFYSMTRLYMLRTIRSWNTWMTPASFLTSTLLLGSLAAGVGLALNPAAEGALVRLPLVWIAVAAVFLVGIRLVITTLNAGGGAPIWIAAQVSLTVFTLSITSMLLYQSAVFELSGRSAALSWLVVLAFLGALAEEAIGRFLFYLSFERAGI